MLADLVPITNQQTLFFTKSASEFPALCNTFLVSQPGIDLRPSYTKNQPMNLAEFYFMHCYAALCLN